MARSGRHAHHQRRPQRGGPAALHGAAVRGVGEVLRRVVRGAPHRRGDAGRQRGPDGLAPHGACPRPLPGHGDRAHLGGRGSPEGPVPGRGTLRRRPLGPGGRPRGPIRRHPRLRHCGPHVRRRGVPQHVGLRHRRQLRRHVGRRDRTGHHHLRALRELRRPLGTGGGPDVRPGAAHPRHGAPVPGNRTTTRDRPVAGGDRGPRRGSHRLRW